MQVAAYLDDWLIWAQSPEEGLKAAQRTIHFLQSLEFVINFKKSRLMPQQTFTWLGLEWNL